MSDAESSDGREMVGARIDAELYQKLKTYQDQHPDMSESGAIRELLKAGYEAEESEDKSPARDEYAGAVAIVFGLAFAAIAATTDTPNTASFVVGGLFIMLANVWSLIPWVVE